MKRLFEKWLNLIHCLNHNVFYGFPSDKRIAVALSDQQTGSVMKSPECFGKEYDKQGELIDVPLVVPPCSSCLLRDAWR